MSWKIDEYIGYIEIYPEDEFVMHRHRGNDKELEDFVLGCSCDPRSKYEGNVLIVMHNSFDGREGVEWANEVLKQNNEDKK